MQELQNKLAICIERVKVDQTSPFPPYIIGEKVVDGYFLDPNKFAKYLAQIV